MRCAVAVVEHGSFTQAARALHLSQPSLSYAIGRLETELGTQLFERLGRRVVLTPAGEAALGPARHALRDADNVRAAVVDAAGVVTGRLDLVALRTLVEPVAELVGAFRARNPQVAVMLHDPQEDSRVLELVRSGQCEVGLARMAVLPLDLDGPKLFDEEFVAVFPADTRIRDGPIPMSELARHPLVVPPRGTQSRASFDAGFATLGLVADAAVECAHVESILALVRNGAGASILAESAVRPREGIVTRPFAPPVRAHVRVVHRRSHCSPAALAFTELALELAS